MFEITAVRIKLRRVYHFFCGPDVRDRGPAQHTGGLRDEDHDGFGEVLGRDDPEESEHCLPFGRRPFRALKRAVVFHALVAEQSWAHETSRLGLRYHYPGYKK